MENTTEKENAVIDAPAVSKIITVVMENKSDTDKAVDLFSPDCEVPEGVIISIRDSNGDFNYAEFVKDLHRSKKSMLASGIKIHGDDFPDFMNRVVVKKSMNGSLASRDLLPILYMSPFHPQSQVAHIQPYKVWIESGFSVNVILPPKKTICYSFFIEAEMESSYKMEYMAGNQVKDIYGTCMPIMIENASDEIVDVKLFDENENLNNSESPVKVTTVSGMSYDLIMKMIKDDNGARSFKELTSKLNSLKIWSDNQKQFGGKRHRGGEVYLKEFSHKDEKGENIFKEYLVRPYQYISPYQYQSNFMDIEGVVKYTWDKECNVKITVLPKTKALYIFYELISDRERDIAEFELANKNILDRLKLKLVRE
jgi:hypothetical protein